MAEILSSRASDASGASPPAALGIPKAGVPLAKEINRAGMIYHEFFRQGDVAIYCAKGKDNRIEYEVFQIQILPTEEFGGKSYPVREAFPSNSEWGELGSSFTDNSHRDPLAVAQLKAQQIAARKKPHSASALSQEQEV